LPAASVRQVFCADDAVDRQRVLPLEVEHRAFRGRAKDAVDNERIAVLVELALRRARPGCCSAGGR